MQFRVRVEVPLKATEDVNKIIAIINKIMDPEKIRVEDSGYEKIVVAESSRISSLAKLHGMLRRERILDAARKRLKRGAKGDTIVFMIHKQALMADRLSLVDEPSESPLGPVTVIIRHSNPKEVIDWLTPPTQKGRPLWEKSVPE